ncbi:MAG: 6,7-dimethyl-8-ribityllumazine synthase [candidate division Zixibacteria bacterium]|nr:6,7-dimethyl-8-ribityllumazine synthase [candidate division Zixibacteria bacterium]MCI0595416.1 6,7-dimethyl-8-ribityllumazine synthase [candidate division Zixibacteria bacterium]
MARSQVAKKAVVPGLAVAGKKFAVVVSRFNSSVTDALLEGALDCFQRHGVAEGGFDVIHVPGSLEIPTACAKLAESKKYAALVALGAVIRGETHHFEVVANHSTMALVELSVKEKIPIACGILTVDNLRQAKARAGGKEGNKGWEAAKTALQMADLMEKL